VAKTAELSSVYQEQALLGPQLGQTLGSLMPIVLIVVIGGLAISVFKK